MGYDLVREAAMSLHGPRDKHKRDSTGGKRGGFTATRSRVLLRLQGNSYNILRLWSGSGGEPRFVDVVKMWLPTNRAALTAVSPRETYTMDGNHRPVLVVLIEDMSGGLTQTATSLEPLQKFT